MECDFVKVEVKFCWECPDCKGYNESEKDKDVECMWCTSIFPVMED